MNSLPNHYQRSSKTRNRDIPVERNSFSSPKVVSIPVHYVGNTTSTSSRSKAALGIQRVFRGFLVRKRVKVILGIKNEVDEVEKKFWDKGFVDLLKKDGKERLKFNEILMGLLFKLDSIRGIDSGVGELRKGVISKVIMLQERLDSIGSEQESLDQEEVEEGNNVGRRGFQFWE
ncbi:Bag family molecular chaperone regulator 5 protein [Thalictrum thalictroides]|uniref:Bag family molecular chaperone regulator 5 protein n=1 Tax=Thalictrum thalictroides TaxID=46969 RepID=A0A7J6W0J5_THATH|nr:Bag family molecular chaperone regulator 5 protein [Thalictrum thalictroides]